MLEKVLGGTGSVIGSLTGAGRKQSKQAAAANKEALDILRKFNISDVNLLQIKPEELVLLKQQRKLTPEEEVTILQAQTEMANVQANPLLKEAQLLKESDWTQISDSLLDSIAKTAWATYRQQFRDLPASQNIDEMESQFEVV